MVMLTPPADQGGPLAPLGVPRTSSAPQRPQFENCLIADDHPAFQLLPHMVEGTRRIAMIQERLARRAVRSAAVRVLPCPFEAVPVGQAMRWHPVHAQDAAHIWLRRKAEEVGETLTATP